MNQCDVVLKHLKEKGSISTIEAFFDYHITRLPSRIFDLRSRGVDIETNIVWKKSEKGAIEHYAVYTLK